MAREIERKFLLANATWRTQVQASTPLRQGYLCGNTQASVRVRIAGEQATLNIKSATLGIERQEFEYPIPLADAQTLLDELASHCIEKIRHSVPVGAHHWEIDEFLGANAGLTVAELELATPDAAFPRPDWLGEEVSHDPRYYNTELARHPYSTWSAQ